MNLTLKSLKSVVRYVALLCAGISSQAHSQGFELGVAVERTFVSGDSSPFVHGPMDAALVYVERGQLGFALGKTFSSDPCNDNLGVVRIDWRPTTMKLPFDIDSVLGLRWHHFSDSYYDLCDYGGGAIINIPLPYIGVRKSLIDGPVNLKLELQATTYGFTVQTRLGF